MPDKFAVKARDIGTYVDVRVYVPPNVAVSIVSVIARDERGTDLQLEIIKAAPAAIPR